MKWNANNISLFLQLYQQFPALWNIRDKNYCNKSLRDTVFKQLMSELEENQLLGQMDKKQLKAKIKSIKDVYRTELNKIEKSKKSGCGADDVYVPKLTWFNDACFLSEVLATRSSQSNLVSKCIYMLFLNLITKNILNTFFKAFLVQVSPIARVEDFLQ